jgi:hypothetical protein
MSIKLCFFYNLNNIHLFKLKKYIDYYKFKIAKTEKDESTNSFAVPRLITYNGNTKVPTNMTT